MTSRSNAEEHIFRDSGDYTTGITVLGDAVRRGLAVCHAFCLMPTHYHVLGTFDDVSRAAHALNRAYAVAFNKRYRRRGHVFDSPPTILEVTDDSYLVTLAAYMALNPPDREAWPYSSYLGTIGVRPQFAFVDDSPIVGAVGSREAFRRFVDERLEDRNQVAAKSGNLVPDSHTSRA